MELLIVHVSKVHIVFHLFLCIPNNHNLSLRVLCNLYSQLLILVHNTLCSVCCNFLSLRPTVSIIVYTANPIKKYSCDSGYASLLWWSTLSLNSEDSLQSTISYLSIAHGSCHEDDSQKKLKIADILKMRYIDEKMFGCKMFIVNKEILYYSS